GFPLGQGQRPQLLLQLAPLVVRIKEETAVQTAGGDEVGTESLTELGGDDEPALVVHGMAVLAQKHRSRRPRFPRVPVAPTFPHPAPLLPTRSPPACQLLPAREKTSPPGNRRGGNGPGRPEGRKAPPPGGFPCQPGGAAS